MTRATLLSTTAAILLPLAGAFAQDTDSDVTATTDSGASAEVSAETELETNDGENLSESVSDTAENAMDEAGEAAEQAGEAIEDTGEAAASTAEEAVDETAETAEQVGDAAEETGEAAASTAENAAEETGEAAEQAADAVTPETDTEATADAEAGAAGSMTVGQITGMAVIDAAGDEIGEVDMVVSHDGGTAAVIGVGGFLGILEHDVAIPTADLTMNGDGQLQLTGYTEEELENLPEFEQDGAQALDDEQPVPDLG